MTSPLSRWVAANGPFRNSPLTFTGMLLCIFATVVGLVAVSSDQTGFSAASVTKEFRHELGSDNHISNDLSRGTPSVLRFASVQSVEPQVDHRQRLRFEEEELFTFEEETRGPIDRASGQNDDEELNGFRHFVREVNRLGATTSVRVTETISVIDVVASQVSSERVRAEQLASAIRLIHERMFRERNSSLIEYRVTLWAPTPTLEAIRVTTEQANELERAASDLLEEAIGADAIISVECACWMLPDAPRPAYSVQAILRVR